MTPATTTMQHTPLVPWWLAMPVAALVLVLLARYLLAVAPAAMEPRRKRIRTVNTFLMMLVTPLVAYGFGVAVPSRPRAYVFTWVLICSLLFMIILLALLDMANSVRIHRAQVRSLRRSMSAQSIMESHAAIAAKGLPKPDDRAR
jgi:ABC-type dipeptide/oligopeptide/nickel transport system permease subunit